MARRHFKTIGTLFKTLRVRSARDFSYNQRLPVQPVIIHTPSPILGLSTAVAASFT